MSSCWEFPGRFDHNGHGQVWWDGKYRSVHRLVFEAIYGYLPSVVRHRCDNPPCYNPAHLLPGTQADNVRDMLHRGRHRNGNTSKTQCPRGHQYDEANTYKDPAGRRHCRSCKATQPRRQTK